MLISLLLGVLGLVVLLGFLLVISPGEPRILVDASGVPVPGALSEKTFVDINGVRQGMFIESTEPSHPVLLFVHGGPGMPEYFMNERYRSGLEELFTVCWWEQRGAGLSYDPNQDVDALTAEQLVLDTIAVSEYLRKRFSKERIYLLGHSWGSFIAIQAAARAPELYAAYLGMGQVVNQRRSEALALQYALGEFTRRGELGTAQKLEAITFPARGPLPGAWMSMRDDVMHRLGVGTTRDMASVVTGIFFPVWMSRAYTVREKINIWRGKISSRTILFESMLDADLPGQVPRLDVPAHFFHGEHDRTTSYDLAKAYARELEAPKKAFHAFPEAAHSPLFESPARFMRILSQDLLVRGSSIADPAVVSP